MTSATALGRSASAAAISVFLLSAGAAHAQDAAAEAEGDEIVVTGVRASLERAMDIKRESNGVVDAISAEDIGKFPDTNLADSLQRIPGVSISRVNGEGSQVTVRGFGPAFNLVTVNGRQLATSSVDAVGGDQNVDFGRATSRSFDFSNLAAEGVSRLEVYKTGRAASPSGGIGAAINIVTQRPLDGRDDGLRGSVGGKLLYDSSVDFKDITPELSGVLSWSNAENNLGISLFGSYQKRNSAAASATSNDWNIRPFSSAPGVGASTVVTNGPDDPAQLVAVPNDSRYHYSESSRERLNGQLTLQFKPTEALTVTADAIYAQNKVDEARSDQTNWFNRPFDTVTFDGNPVVATAVQISEGAGYAVKDIGFEQQYRATKSELTSFGLNAALELTDNLTFSVDGNHSRSESSPNSANGASSTLVSFGAPVVDAHSVDYRGPIPLQNWVLDDAERGNGNGVLDIGDLGTQVQRTNASTQIHRLNQISADLAWDFGNGGNFALGAAYIDSKMTSARTQTQQTLGDWGITRVGDVQEIAGNLIQQYCLQCQFSRYNPTSAEIAFRGNAVELYQAFAAAYEARGNPINVTGNDFDEVNEKIWSTYAQLNWSGDMMGRPAKIVAGVRFENTKVTSSSLIALPDRIEWDSDNDFSRVVSATIAPVSLKGDYTNLLPSIDFQIEPADDLVARVSYSRTLARPDYGNLFASQSANAPNRPTFLGGVATGSSGNPGLKPLVSDNFDVSLEWYFDRSSYISAGFFYKNVKNFVGVGQVDQPLFGLRDPSSGAAGSRSGEAVAELNRLGVEVTDVSLFTMTALLVETGNIAAASTQFQANLNPATGQINQAFADTVLGRTDVIANASDPLFNFSVATPINNRSGNIHGFELQGQYFLGETGFGISASLTKVFGDVGVDVGADPTANVFALVGLSDSFNITGIYEKGPLSARVAYNWRGEFLAGTNRGSSRNPVFFEPFGTLDASLGYNLTDNISLSFEAINILSEPVRSFGRDPSNLWFAQEQQPRYLLGARYKF
ncbi:MAG: TonB-dependent receptor [Sphingomonadales bacterium]|nr:TonB-dependent receptor [Sphingomonadales bacterium]